MLVEKNCRDAGYSSRNSVAWRFRGPQFSMHAVAAMMCPSRFAARIKPSSHQASQVMNAGVPTAVYWPVNLSRPVSRSTLNDVMQSLR